MNQYTVKGTSAERFWQRVRKSDGCWLWSAGKVGRPGENYGGFRFNGKSTRAHRISWELTHGPVPAGLCVLHRCDTPPCVRPDHLFLGTQYENMRDKIAKGRANWHTGPRPPEHVRTGEAHSQAILTWDQVREIRRAWDNSEPGGFICDLARRYGVTRGCIAGVVYRRTWKE